MHKNAQKEIIASPMLDEIFVSNNSFMLSPD